PLRHAWPDTIIYHYMDDILFAQPEPFTGQRIQAIYDALKLYGLTVASEKIQLSAPWKYLGWTLTDQIVTPQKLQLHIKLHTLHDVQKLLGDLQWLRPIVGIPNELLDELRPLLKGTDPAQPPVRITPEQVKTLQQILDCVTQGSVRRRDLDLPIQLTVWCGTKFLLGALTQHNRKTGEIWALEWISPPLQQHKTLLQKIEILADLLKKGRERTVQIMGKEPDQIQIPMKKDTLTWYLANSMEFQEALLGAGSVTATDDIPNVPLNWVGQWGWIQCPKRSLKPLSDAITVYTDAGRKSKTAAVTWREKGQWHHHILRATELDTLQTMELLAVVWAM
ncbi:PO113 protein, partial [Molothrus ater]|nr:PO113 protein [Molothrus ater]